MIDLRSDVMHPARMASAGEVAKYFIRLGLAIEKPQVRHRRERKTRLPFMGTSHSARVPFHSKDAIFYSCSTKSSRFFPTDLDLGCFLRNDGPGGVGLGSSPGYA